MIRANFVSARGAWHAKAADSVVLGFDDRHRRRIAMKGVRGLDFLLDLPEAVTLRHGDALVLEDGRLVEVVAAPEPLAEIRCGEPRDLARLAWHLGNRHLPIEILANRLRIRRDEIIEAMARGLGAKIAHIEAPFEPEGGAYAAASVHDDHREVSRDLHGDDHGHHHDNCTQDHANDHDAHHGHHHDDGHDHRHG